MRHIMSSLNILSSIEPASPESQEEHQKSLGSGPHAIPTSIATTNATDDLNTISQLHRDHKHNMEDENEAEAPRPDGAGEIYEHNEKTPLLSDPMFDESDAKSNISWSRRVIQSCAGVVTTILSTVTAPVRYVIACFYNDEGYFSVAMPFYTIARTLKGRRTENNGSVVRGTNVSEKRATPVKPSGKMKPKKNKRAPATPFEGSAISSDSEADSSRPSSSHGLDSPARHTRSRSSLASQSGDEIAPSSRTIRIKLHSDDPSKPRKRRSQSNKTSKDAQDADQDPTEAAAAALKSPSSPATHSKITKFPRAPQPPRPLVPRRQPSYSAAIPPAIGPHPHKKTLIIDLDETLIHSMSKGGRFTTGHMVEVKLQQPVPADGTVLQPQVPILYYVHKRPYCDEFLRKVSKWYNLIVFTASVQEYADPVINWLELERKYFYRRLYRQHCTFRNGSYIKDLSQVEPDLSKVMILDNSPMSYVFHEDNAIPIEGWISDPTDNDLLHLVPFLEGLQYVTDVRALLALRIGQPQAS